jgi:hypothetical protein
MVMAEKKHVLRRRCQQIRDLVRWDNIKSKTWSGETISNQRLGQVRQYQIRDLVRWDNIKSETWSGETISNQKLGQVRLYQIRDLVRWDNIKSRQQNSYFFQVTSTCISLWTQELPLFYVHLIVFKSVLSGYSLYCGLISWDGLSSNCLIGFQLS